MVAQTVLPFKLEITKDEITSHAGLAVFGEFVHAMDVPGLVDRVFSKPGSGAGYFPSQFVEPLILMLHGGGRSLEDLRQIRMDTGLREILRLRKLPSSDTVGDWLRRMGDGIGLPSMKKVNRRIVRRALNRDDRTEFTLDIDATQIVAEKKTAKKTYKNEYGYMPIVGHLSENGLVIGHEFRDGNAAPHSRNFDFLKHCVSQMPKGKRIAHFRADSAAYQAKIIDYCVEKEMTFAIGADLDSSVQAAIKKIPESNWRSFRDVEIAETVHTMNKTKSSFRLIVMRRWVQQDLFEKEQPHWRYNAMVSNCDETAEDTIVWYNQRGDSSENRIKELKIGFGMERMPCGQFGANAMFFAIGVLAYNIFILFKQDALPNEYRKFQVQTLRWRLYQTAGKVVSHAGYTILKVKRWMFALMEEIRTRSFELASE